MAVASLNKFTVPLQTDQSAGSQGLLMPKLKYRFRAQFINFGLSQPTTELTKQVVDIKRPSVNFNPVTIDVYNSKIYMQGKPEWQETTVNFRDDSSGTVNTLIGEQIQKQFDFMEQASAPSGIDYKFSMVFDVLDGGNGATVPNVLESWDLEGCFLASVDYGDMAYNSSDPVQIACTIRFDNAVQTVGGAVGVPQLTTRTPAGPITG
jgi:hypothetical protein